MTDTKKKKKVRRIINDISFGRFIRALVWAVREHPEATLEGSDCGDDERAENAFMFRAVLNYEVEK